MAWSIPTFAGAEATGTPSGWRVAMFEFCRAINEREACFPLTKTTFRATDGTLAADREIDDFLGMDPAGAYALENWEKIMQWVIDNLSRFTTTSGGTTVWTKTALEEDIDMFAFWSAPQSTTHALFFQQCKEAFDRLIYAKMGVTPRANPGPPYTPATVEHRAGVGYESTLSDAWGAAYAETPSSSSLGGISPKVGWGVIHNYTATPSPVHTYRAGIDGNVSDIFILMPDFLGTVSAAYQPVTWAAPFYNSGDGNLVDGMTCSFLGATFSIDELIGSSSYTDVQPVSISGLTRGAINYRDWTIDIPSTVPFSAPDNNKKGTVEVTLGGISFYVDIAAELTDQA